MSFFDDEEDGWGEEPEAQAPPTRAASAQPRPRPRTGGSGGSGTRGGSRRPSGRAADPAVERRRLIAIAGIVVVVILMIVLISSCQASNTKNSLKDYNNSVSSLITRSDATGKDVFKALSSGSSGASIQQDLTGSLQDANSQLTDAEALSVPGQMAQAQSHLLLALRMRRDGISTIAHYVLPAAGGSGSAAKAAVNEIALGTARFYASDVIYKGYSAPEIAGALHGDSIPIGGTEGVTINPGQFLTDLGWLQTSYIATTLGVTGVSSGGGGSGGQNSDQPGLHGEALDATSVGSSTLSTSGTTDVPGSPAPTFSISVTNAGDFTENAIGCKVSVNGGPSGSSSIPTLASKATGTCTVKLSGAVTPGTYQVTVTIAKVPGETNLTNNTATYPVNFN